MSVRLACTLVAACLLVSACATGYQAIDRNGIGYDDQVMLQDSYLVSFVANSNTSQERVQDFAMLRAAQIAASHGFTYFSLVENNFETLSKSLPPCKANFFWPVGSGSGQMYITNSQVNSKYNAVFLEVHLAHGVHDDTSTSIFNADEVIREMDKKYSLTISAGSAVVVSSTESDSGRSCY